MMNDTVLLNKISDYVLQLFEEHNDSKLVYHNATHTKKVVANVHEIAKYYMLSEDELFIVLAAAWLHDTGHLFVGFETHEEESVRIAHALLSQLEVKQDVVNKVADCIMSTKYPVNPQTRLEQIICDADTYNVGTEEFKTTDDLVHRELELRTGKCISNWHTCAMEFLMRHRFFTSYCKKKLDAGKAENISYLQSLIQKRA